MLSYRQSYNGKQDWVVFIHGIGGSSNAFKKQIDDFSLHFNLLFIDMYGHASSKDVPLYKMEKQNFEAVAQGVIDVLDECNIESAYFCGLSLGTLIIAVLSKIAPNRIKSMVSFGLATSFTWRLRILIPIGSAMRKIFPYMIVYFLFAHLMMPKRNHRKSRTFFIQEARKIGHKEFFAWFDIIQRFEKDYPIKSLINETSKLVVMGSEDHMFLKPAIKFSKVDNNCRMHVVNKSGHVVNIDNAAECNRVTLEFLNEDKLYEPFDEVAVSLDEDEVGN